MFHMKLHRLLFYIFLFLIPIQTRVLYNPDSAYISWYFSYHLAFFLYLSDLVLFLCIFTWIFFDKPRVPRKHWLIGAIVVVLLTMFHVKQPDLALYGLFKLAEMGFLLLYIKGTYTDKKDYLVSLGVLFTSALTQAGLAWYQFHVQHMLGLGWLGEYMAAFGTPGLSTIDTATGKVVRAYGTFPHPNVLAGFLLGGLVSGMYFVSHGTKWLKVLSAFGITLIGIGLFATFSRNAWIAAAIAVVAYLAYYIWTNRKREAIIVTLSIVIAIVAVMGFYKPQLASRVSNQNTASVEDRGMFNRMGWELIKENPILGSGIGNYVPALQNKYNLEPWQYQPPHNILIFIAAELGLLGIGLFILLLWFVFSRLKNIFTNDLNITLVLIGSLFLLMGMLDHYFVTIQQGRLIFATVLGLIAGLPNLYDNQKSN